MGTEIVIPGSQKIIKSKLKTWVESYILSTAKEKNETRSCLFHLESLIDFLDRIKSYNKINGRPKIDAVRIYFIKCNENQQFLKLSDKLTSQTTVAIVPAREFNIRNPHDISANDILDEPTLSWIVPGYSNETSGLCPPNCNGTIGKGG